MNPVYRPLSSVQRVVLIGIGTASLGMGILGMLLPGVPTTIFLIIATACYTRSSERMYNWVVTRPWLQRPLKTVFEFERTGVVPVKIKLLAQGVAWSSVLLTVLGGAKLWTQWVTIAFAVACSIAMLIFKSDGVVVEPQNRANQRLAGMASGALAGLISGMAACATFRFVANLAGLPWPFDAQFAVMALAVGLILGALCGVVYAGIERALPSAKHMRGVLVGAVALFTLGVLLYLSVPVQTVMGNIGEQWRGVAVALLGIDFIAFGLMLSLGYGRIARTRP